MTESHRFGMFAKFWGAGHVKTRLARDIGDEAAARVYHAFVETLVWRFRNRDQSELVYSPDDREEDFRRLTTSDRGTHHWRLHPQGSGDLGERIKRFFARTFAEGHSKATLIGSDSPTLPSNRVSQAHWLLEGHHVVLGPSEDGGYYLVAAKESVPPIFDGIQWSSQHVLHQTIDRIQQHGLSFAVLPTWYDVDDIEGLARLQAELKSICRTAFSNGQGDGPPVAWQDADKAWARKLTATIHELLGSSDIDDKHGILPTDNGRQG